MDLTQTYLGEMRGSKGKSCSYLV